MLSLDSSAGSALLDLMNFQGEQIEQVPCAFVSDNRSVTFGMLRTTFVNCLPLGLIRRTCAAYRRTTPVLACSVPVRVALGRRLAARQTHTPPS